MRTRRNPSFWLAAILALSAACGDDKDDNGDGNTTGGNTGGEDAGDNTGDKDGGDDPFAAACKKGGLYDGFKGSDLKANIASKGECITDDEIVEVCAINPSTPAADAGGKCFLNNKKDDDLRTCTIEGDTGLGITGLRKAAPSLSDGCLDCYAESVACSAEAGCGTYCVTAPTGEDCVKCREDAGCTPTFYACSGLPRAEDI